MYGKIRVGKVVLRKSTPSMERFELLTKHCVSIQRVKIRVTQETSRMKCIERTIVEMATCMITPYRTIVERATCMITTYWTIVEMATCMSTTYWTIVEMATCVTVTCMITTYWIIV